MKERKNERKKEREKDLRPLSGELQAERDARAARQAFTFPTSPADVAAGQVLNLRDLAAQQQQLQARFLYLDAYVWSGWR
jgi:hypothetical protein